MEHQKILNLLNEESDSKFVTRKRKNINHLSNRYYDVGNEVIYNIEVIKSNLCDYNDVYILERGDITIAGNVAARVTFKNCVPFTKCITKIDGTTTDDAEDLNLVIRMYTLGAETFAVFANFGRFRHSL